MSLVIPLLPMKSKRSWSRSQFMFVILCQSSSVANEKKDWEISATWSCCCCAFRDIVVKRNKIITLTGRYVALWSAQWCAKLIDFKYRVIITNTNTDTLLLIKMAVSSNLLYLIEFSLHLIVSLSRKNPGQNLGKVFLFLFCFHTIQCLSHLRAAVFLLINIDIMNIWIDTPTTSYRCIGRIWF